MIVGSRVLFSFLTIASLDSGLLLQHIQCLLANGLDFAADAVGLGSIVVLSLLLMNPSQRIHESDANGATPGPVLIALWSRQVRNGGIRKVR